MKDQEFDAFFRNAAEGLEVPYQSDAWRKMQKKLDKPGWTAYLRGGLWGLGALLLISALWWSVFPWFQIDELSGKEKLNEHENRRFQSPVFWKQPLLKKQDDLVKFPFRLSFYGDEKLSQNPDNVFSKRYREHELVMTSHHEPMEPEQIVPLPGLGLFSKEWMLPEAKIKVVSLNDPLMQHEPNEKRQHQIPRWGISLGLSPDLSGVGFRHIEDISSKGSFQLEYFVGPLFSLNSGIIFTRMIYQASPEDYRREMSYRPDWINAQCRVLEIPLNLRWYAWRGVRQRFFLSGGLSSYLMLTEDYEYVYQSEDRGIYTRDWGVKNENYHFFKVASLSVGYERSLGKRWSLQAEPFVKLPLVGVGAGQVKLSTAGIFFSVNYRWGSLE